MTGGLVPQEIEVRYEVHQWRHGVPILAAARPTEWAEILEVLRGFQLLKSQILQPGGSKSLISGRIDGHFTRLGWHKSGSTPKSLWMTSSMRHPRTRSTATRIGWRWTWSGTTRIPSSIATS